MKTKKELENILKDITIDYRPNLKLNEDVTIGLEIEFVEGYFYQIEKELKKPNNLENKWIIYDDPTVVERNKINRKKDKGGEVLSPTITKEINIWKDLKKVCEIIKKAGGTVDVRAAGHIHIGAQTFQNKETMNNFLLIWASFEEEINKFLAGEFIYPKENNPLAIDCKNEFINANYNFETLLDKREAKEPTKIYSVGTFYFSSFYFLKYNTIEFRKIRGTLEEEIWQNNIVFLLNLIEYAKNISKEDFIFIKENFITTKKEEPNYEKAIWLANKIYNNELEKMYFFKQYFKNFEDGKDKNDKTKITKKNIVKKL